MEYKGRVDVSIQVIIFNQDGSVLETHTINPKTGNPFSTIEEAESYLEERLAELNSTNTNQSNVIKIYVVDAQTNLQISSGVVGQEVKLIIESDVNIEIDKLYIPVVDQFSGQIFIVSATKVENNKWESQTFPFKVSGLFNIDETKFKPINNLSEDIKVEAHDVIVASI